ncbi:hypothetical protein QGX11_gp093 [Pseudomonas phage PPSC2]|uniref:Uncharacterized protein n=1 Tax=Pseudomonas phage PPSC2 TaxID=2041350 RepID=A0A2R2YAR0_9CAUD|nr:hypothetical protein QGX11_gp093 [Pseudomonas phage PPSC2]ATN92856.1 hypothetical protein PPSC2_93 [Pseudomonas phage PPSC2]
MSMKKPNVSNASKTATHAINAVLVGIAGKLSQLTNKLD